MSLYDRFWSKVVVGMECWGWVASTDKNGYGYLRSLNGTRAHRASYELHCGSVPEGMCVLHKCDNPPCTNPAHLFLGTMSDNNRDKVSKGRSGVGESNPNSVLTADKVLQIKDLLSAGDHSQGEIAAMFGVKRAAISKIRCERSWAKCAGL